MTKRGKVKELPIDDIEYDKTNPRIAKVVEMYGDDVTADQIALALGSGDSQIEGNGTTFQSLKASIKTNGGLIHPILVNKEKNGKHLVIEGNTRLAIYREFNEHDVNGDWDTITAIVYDSLNQEEIDAIRLQTHLVTPRAWNPYSKAKYLDHLRNSEHITLSQVIDYCGGRKRDVIDLIQAYQEMETYYRPQLESDDQFDVTRFSAFVELQNRKRKNALLESGFSLNDFAKWIIDFKFHPLKTVRQLHNILRNPESKKIFLSQSRGAAQAAIKVLETPPPETSLKEATLMHLTRELINRILSLHYRDLQWYQEEQESEEVQAICEARDQLIGLCKDIFSQE